MPFYYGYDPTWFLLLPALILSLYAQYKVNSTFKKYSKVPNRNGYTGAEVARQILQSSGINDVQVEHIKGNLTDHYDPREKVLRLSDAVYNSASLAAIGVAAHETGHAIQHDKGYLPLGIRNFIYPVTNFGSKLAGPLIMIGLIVSMWGGEIGLLLLDIGIILYAVIVMFQLVTLPVEFNASRRAIETLGDYNYLYAEELTPAKKVLNAAALTYVAAAASAILQLVRFIMISNSRRR